MVLLLGTSHVSAASAQLVEKVARVVRPDNVVVEVCRSRAGLLYSREEAEKMRRKAAKTGRNAPLG